MDQYVKIVQRSDICQSVWYGKNRHEGHEILHVI